MLVLRPRPPLEAEREEAPIAGPRARTRRARHLGSLRDRVEVDPGGDVGRRPGPGRTSSTMRCARYPRTGAAAPRAGRSRSGARTRVAACSASRSTSAKAPLGTTASPPLAGPDGGSSRGRRPGSRSRRSRRRRRASRGPRRSRPRGDGCGGTGGCRAARSRHEPGIERLDVVEVGDDPGDDVGQRPAGPRARPRRRCSRHEPPRPNPATSSRAIVPSPAPSSTSRRGSGLVERAPKLLERKADEPREHRVDVGAGDEVARRTDRRRVVVAAVAVQRDLHERSNRSGPCSRIRRGAVRRCGSLIARG